MEQDDEIDVVEIMNGGNRNDLWEKYFNMFYKKVLVYATITKYARNPKNEKGLK